MHTATCGTGCVAGVSLHQGRGRHWLVAAGLWGARGCRILGRCAKPPHPQHRRPGLGRGRGIAPGSLSLCRMLVKRRRPSLARGAVVRKRVDVQCSDLEESSRFLVGFWTVLEVPCSGPARPDRCEAKVSLLGRLGAGSTQHRPNLRLDRPSPAEGPHASGSVERLGAVASSGDSCSSSSRPMRSSTNGRSARSRKAPSLLFVSCSEAQCVTHLVGQIRGSMLVGSDSGARKVMREACITTAAPTASTELMVSPASELRHTRRCGGSPVDHGCITGASHDILLRVESSTRLGYARAAFSATKTDTKTTWLATGFEWLSQRGSTIRFYVSFESRSDATPSESLEPMRMTEPSSTSRDCGAFDGEALIEIVLGRTERHLQLHGRYCPRLEGVSELAKVHVRHAHTWLPAGRRRFAILKTLGHGRCPFGPSGVRARTRSWRRGVDTSPTP